MLGKILLVEDVVEVQMIVKATLQSVAELDCAGSIAEAEVLLKKNNYSLLLLDGHLPDGDGFEYCKNLREKKEYAEVPIIFLTGQSEVNRKVLGFSLGADDYITKPIEPAEFVARVMSKLKKAQSSATSFRKGGFHADLNVQKVYIAQDGKETDLGLTPIEFKILVHFFRNEGKTVSREELLKQVWGNKIHVSDHTVDTHISSLRKKMGPSSKMIKAVIKNGYRFNSSLAVPKESI